jgi:hypothetical protein
MLKVIEKLILQNINIIINLPAPQRSGRFVGM